MPFLNAAAKEKLLQVLIQNQIPYEIKTWKNFTRDVVVKDAIILQIRNESELQRAKKIILDFNKNENGNQDVVMRDAAGGLNKEYSESFSMTACAEGDVIAHIVGDLNHKDNIRKIAIIDKEKKLVEIGANVSVEDVDSILYGNDHSESRFVLPTSSLIGKVSLIGLLSNSGHGTGIAQPAVAGLIKGMKFCLPNGEIVRILPPDEDNIEKEVASRDGVKTLRHPDFDDIRGSSLGLFGTLLSVDVECIDAKKIQTIKEPRTNDELINEVKNGLFTAEAPYVSVMIIPKYNASHQKNICIRKQTPVPLSVPDAHSHPWLADLEQKALIGISEVMHTTTIMSAEKNAIPKMMDIIASTQVPDCDTIQVGHWPDQMHFQTQYPHAIDNFDYLFEVSPDSHEIVETLEFMNQLLDKHAKAENPNYPVVFAGYIRVINGTQGGLSTSHHEAGKFICGFDIVSNQNIEGYSQFKKEMQNYFIDIRHAKPHWGKTVPLDVDYSQVYAGENRFEKFKGVLSRWYEKCGLTLERNPVINAFFKQILKIAPAPQLALVEEKQAANDTVSFGASHRQGFFSYNRRSSMLDLEQLMEVPREELPVRQSSAPTLFQPVKAAATDKQNKEGQELKIKKPRKMSCCSIQ
ncbi:MAG: hypothetical protein P4M14_04470 [Gammaproteobacteria bacterium]|nr:hypothetical protein [Gammaproteobacteria bacterium]